MSPRGVAVVGPAVPEIERVLTEPALDFVADLQRAFDPRRLELARPAPRPPGGAATAGRCPGFLSETAEVRAGDWQVAPAPADLDDRRVEITGPAEPKMMINALNSGARVFMADLEDALSPTWANVVGGQAALRDAVRARARRSEPGGQGVPAERRDRDARRAPARLAPRRGARAGRRRAGVARACSTSGCTSSTTAGERSSAGSGPYFYLPKLETHLEARLWNDVFLHAQERARHPARARSARPS